MWLTLVQGSLYRKPEKKSLIRNFLFAEFMCCEGSKLGKFKVALKSNKEASRLYAELLLCVCWHTEHI